MGFFDYFLPGLAAGAGFLQGRGGKQTTASQRNLSPEQTDLQKKLTTQYTDLLSNPVNTSGVVANQVSNINHNAQLEHQKLLEAGAVHGLSPESLQAILANQDSNRFQQVAQAQNNAPLLENQLRTSALSQAGNFLNTTPTPQVSTTTLPSNKLGGTFSGAAETIAYLLGKGIIGKKNLPIDPSTQIH